MATMREIAAQAGVSLKTVSRVFNGDAHVRPEIRQRVQAALDAANYVPNELAQVFRSGRGRVVGVAVPDLLDPFYAAIVAAVDAAVKQQGYATLVTATGFDADAEEKSVVSLLSRQLAGLILAPGTADQAYLGRAEGAVPTVSVDQLATGVSVDAFLHDDRRGARLATEHLLGHGFRRIGFVGRAPHLASMSERVDGYREALEAAGLAFDPVLVVNDVDSPVEVAAALGALRGQGVDAVFTADPRTTIAGLPGLQAQPLPFVGFGDFPLADLLTPSVTVIDQDPARMGALAAARILARLHAPGDPAAPAETVTLPVRLLERSSCRPTP